MTEQETAQVTAYIASLQQQHAAALRTMQAQHAHALQVAEKYRKIAQADSLKMGTAVHEIWKLSNQPAPPPAAQLAVYVRQIINHYCPDFDVPF